MISVLLTLLKIIGIVFVSILGLLLILLLIVLFVPVRYRLKGYYKDEFVCHGKFTWLLHLVSVSIDYEKELISSIRILGIDFSSLISKRKDTSADSSQENPTDTKDKEKEALPKSNNDTISAINDDNELSYSAAPHQTEDIPETNTDSESSGSLFDKIRYFFIRIKEKILSIYKKILEIIHNIKSKKDSLGRYLRILQKEEVKNSFSLCKDRIIRMVKHILPKKMKIHAHIGMEDPSTTGYLLAFYSVLPERIRRQIILKADFENVIIEGDYNIKGALHAYKFLYYIISIIINKNCRTFYTLVKKEISNERK